MKGMGGFLNKTSVNESKKKTPGYLIRDSCGGFYELQTGEKPEDFSAECECGGNFETSHEPASIVKE